LGWGSWGGSEAVGVYDEVVTRFGRAEQPALREWVARALFYKGLALGQLDRWSEAVAVYDEVLTRFGRAEQPALREQVAKALVYKGIGLGQLGRWSEAVAVCDEVLARFGRADDPALREWVAAGSASAAAAALALSRLVTAAPYVTNHRNRQPPPAATAGPSLAAGDVAPSTSGAGIATPGR